MLSIAIHALIVLFTLAIAIGAIVFKIYAKRPGKTWRSIIASIGIFVGLTGYFIVIGYLTLKGYDCYTQDWKIYCPEHVVDNSP